MPNKQNRPQTKEEYRRSTVLKLLPMACQMPNSDFAINVLKVKPPFWNAIKSGAPFPSRRLAMLEADFRRRFKKFAFEVAHLNLEPRAFVELFHGELVYPDLLRALGVVIPSPPPEPHRLSKYFGTYLGLYLCRDAGNREKEAVAFDAYQISDWGDGNRTRARVRQLTNAFTVTAASSDGNMQVLFDTIEISIPQENLQDPNATYMAAAPRGEAVDSILAMGTDIKAGTRLVVSRPTLFIRIEAKDVPGGSDILPEGNTLHTKLRNIFERYIMVDAKRYEITASTQLNEKDAQDVLSDLLEILPSLS